MGTATVVNFDGTDVGAAKTQIETLAPTDGDFTFEWTINNRTYIAKYEP